MQTTRVSQLHFNATEPVAGAAAKSSEVRERRKKDPSSAPGARNTDLAI